MFQSQSSRNCYQRRHIRQQVLVEDRSQEDKVTPQLAPAYDLVSTIYYVQNDSLALNMGEEKRFELIDESHFDRLSRRMEVPPKFMLDVVKQTVATARKEWGDPSGSRPSSDHGRPSGPPVGFPTCCESGNSELLTPLVHLRHFPA